MPEELEEIESSNIETISSRLRNKVIADIVNFLWVITCLRRNLVIITVEETKGIVKNPAAVIYTSSSNGVISRSVSFDKGTSAKSILQCIEEEMEKKIREEGGSETKAFTKVELNLEKEILVIKGLK